MRARINYCWRTLVTSGCFIAFAVLGLLFSLLVYPVLCLLEGERRHAPAKWLLHKFFSLIVFALRSTGCMRLQTSGIDRLQQTLNAKRIGQECEAVLLRHTRKVSLSVTAIERPQ